MSTTPPVQLAAMSDLPNYRVCSEDSDPRGWRIVDSNSIVLGTVSDLIIDVDALTARYIVCALTRGEPRSVLVPTGFARLAQDDNTVYLDFVNAGDVDRLPDFEGLPLSERQVAQSEEVLTGVAPPASAEAKIVRRNDATRNAS